MVLLHSYDHIKQKQGGAPLFDALARSLLEASGTSSF